MQVDNRLVADGIGFLVLVFKSTFDLYVNEKMAKRDEARLRTGKTTAHDLREASSLAFTHKIERRDRSNVLTFAGLATSYLVSIAGAIYAK